MKKTVLFAVALVAATAATAQTGEITSNRGENWLSQDGDWGLTFDAQPFFSYVGNLFNGNTNNSGPAFDWANPYFAIQGKKLIDANTAYRGMLRIGFGSNKTTEKVDQAPQPTPAPDPSAQVDNVSTNSYNNIVLGAGLEKRVGSSRVVGVYGAQAMIMFGGSKTTYDYGNALTNTNQSPGAGEETGTYGRVTESKNGSTFGLGLGVFGGVEWFCAPKISLSGEYMWGLMMSSTGFGESTEERWNTAAANGAGALETATIEGTTDKQNSFSLDTGISGFSVGINFYFQ